jgi:hypothetical protein
MNLPNADDCCRAPAALANEAPVAQDGPYPSPKLVPSQPGRSRGRTHRHAISVPFRARRHRFVTVSHGHSRSSDLQRPYYRCVAARMVRMGSLDRPLGPHRGHTPPESHGQHRTTAATQHRSSAVLLDQHRRSTDHPTSLSHGGSQGFKSPHLHPQHCRSERRQPRAGGAHCMLRPRCGRKLKSQCSPKALRSQPTQAQASHNDHAAWPPPAASRWAILARIQPRSRSATRSAWPTANHLPRRRPSRPSAGPARPAPASSARLQPRADDAPSWTCRATTPTRPSQPRGGRPHRHTPEPHSRRTQRTPERTDAGGRTLDTWTPRTPAPDTGHMDRPPMGHRTLAPDTGHRMPDTNADTVTTAQPHPDLLGRHAERPHAETCNVFVLLHYQPAARPRRRTSGASAHCSRVLELDGTRRGQWDYGKVRGAGSGWCGSADEGVDRVPR